MPGLAQRVGRVIALLFNDHDTRRGWVVSSTPRPHFTPGKYPVPILQEAGWAPGPVWTVGKSRPQRASIPDRPARSQSHIYIYICVCVCVYWLVPFLMCDVKSHCLVYLYDYFVTVILLSPIKPKAYFMYHQVLTFRNSVFFCPQRIFVFCVDLRTNSNCFPFQHSLTDFYNRGRKCLLRGTNCVFKPDSNIFVPKRLTSFQHCFGFGILTEEIIFWKH